MSPRYCSYSFWVHRSLFKYTSLFKNTQASFLGLKRTQRTPVHLKCWVSVHTYVNTSSLMYTHSLTYAYTLIFTYVYTLLCTYNWVFGRIHKVSSQMHRSLCVRLHTSLHAQTHTVTQCNTLQCTATHCNRLQQHTSLYAQTHTATHCNTLQDTATDCNTRLHTSLRICVFLPRLKFQIWIYRSIVIGLNVDRYSWEYWA